MGFSQPYCVDVEIRLKVRNLDPRQGDKRFGSGMFMKKRGMS